MRALLQVVVAIVLALGGSMASAKKMDFVQLDAFGPGKGTATIDLGTWAIGDGTQTWDYLNCAASANYSNKFTDPPPKKNPPAQHEPYQFMLASRDPPSGFYLYLNGNSGNTGNARIPGQAQHRDVKAGTAWQALTDGAYDTQSHDGQFAKCLNGDNSELQMTFAETELEKARAGTYTGHFRAQIEGGTSGSATDSSNFDVMITISNIVRISSLSDIDLGVWDGSSDLVGTETFCVYSNSATAGYALTFSSANQAGSTFRLANSAMTRFVPYTLQFKDSTAGGAGTTVSTGPIAGVGDNSANDCGGVNDARMTVTVTAVNLQGAPPEAYGDTVTLVAAPQ